MRACIILCVEGRIVGAFEFDRILVVAVIRFVIAVEEHLGLIDAAVQQSIDAAAARVMVLAPFIDHILLINIIEVIFAVMLTGF